MSKTKSQIFPSKPSLLPAFSALGKDTSFYLDMQTRNCKIILNTLNISLSLTQCHYKGLSVVSSKNLRNPSTFSISTMTPSLNYYYLSLGLQQYLHLPGLLHLFSTEHQCNLLKNVKQIWLPSLPLLTKIPYMTSRCSLEEKKAKICNLFYTATLFLIY